MIEKWLHEKCIAHRGLHDVQHPENTLCAYKRAIEFGFNIEIDVQLTRDGIPVVFHDLHLKRLTGRDNYLYELDYSDIKANIRYLNSGESIPRFDEVLSLCEGKTGLMIEVKKKSYDTPEIDVELVISPMLKKYKGDFIVKSFNPHSVLWFKTHTPEFCVGLLSEYDRVEAYPKDLQILVKKLLQDISCRVDFFDCAIKLIDSPLYNTALAEGLPIIVWTVKSQACYNAVKPKVTNIIFEDFIPERQLLKE